MMLEEEEEEVLVVTYCRCWRASFLGDALRTRAFVGMGLAWITMREAISMSRNSAWEYVEFPTILLLVSTGIRTWS